MSESLKEFDKWWKEASKDDRRYEPEDDYVARDGWKAALEWALGMEKWDIEKELLEIENERM